MSAESVFYILDSSHSYWYISDGLVNSYDDKILIAGNEFVYQPDDTYTYDKLNAFVANVVSPLNIPINYDYKSAVINYNDVLGRKWTSHIVLNMKDSEDAVGLSTRIRSYADLSTNPHYLDPCFYLQNTLASDQQWGNLNPSWNEYQRAIFKRYFDQSTVRNTYLQVGFDNLKIVKYTDDDFEKATYTLGVDERSILLPTTLYADSPISATDVLDGSWYIRLEEDDYENEYQVLSIENVSTYLQINLPPDTEITAPTPPAQAIDLVQRNHGWKLCQISKEHRFHLLSYSLLYTPMGHQTIPGIQKDAGQMNGE
jgi:hypothetical protein